MSASEVAVVSPDHAARPLTAAEEELWLLEQENLGDPAYLVPFALWVTGPLEVPELARALNDVVARHEILRTVVRSADGSPLAQVLPQAAVACPVTMVGSDAEALAAARALSARTFSAGELRLRAALFRVHSERWLMLLVLHHAVCDLTSLWILLDELAELYTAGVASRAANLPDPVQVADIFAAGVDGDLAIREPMVKAVADAIESAPDIVNLPFDQQDSAVESTKGSLLRLLVPADLNDATERTARRLAVSPNAVLLAAYGVLLDVMAGAADVLVSVPVSRRASLADQRVIGFLVHSVPVRLCTGKCRTADDLIRHAWVALRRGWTHAAVSFGQVVAQVNPRRVPGLNPLCQCEFSAVALPDRLPAFGQATLSYQFVHNGGHKFSLSLEVVSSAGGRAITIEYPAAMFRPSTVRRMANLYLRVLSALTATHTGRLEDIDLVSRAERTWLAEHGGGRLADQDRQQRALDLAARIEAAVLQRPAADAVIAGDEAVSYGELGARSDGLVAVLRAAGVAAGERVAIVGERSAESIVAVVAAIRLGASFLVIADDSPAGRISSMLAAARPAAVVVTSQRLLSMLPHRWRVDAVRCSDCWLSFAGTADRASCPGEAYVVFTSGSTGQPRGVSVSGQAIAAITAAWGAQFDLVTEPGRHLQLAPFSFDVFIGDIARCLGFGGTLVLADRDDVLDPVRLTDLIQRERIDTVEFVPAVARLLSDYLDQVGGSWPTLRRVMVGSDTWMASEALQFRAQLPAAARLYCTYGTSESAVDATFFSIDPAWPADAAVVPIGQPFPGVQASVRDRLGRVLPPRWPGELWIGGATVASGYLPPDEAADCFRAAKAADGRSYRWYRTGDRAVCDENGNLHLLGRMDTETKIRGVRVHPAEIEAVLCQYPAVTAAAVVAVGDARHRMLIGFVTGLTEADCDALAAHARRHLLPMAVPAGFKILDRIPSTRHGKVDYRSLAELATTATMPAAERSEPCGDLEHSVAAISAEALGLPGIGVLDDFYALGASSVHVARLAWRVSLAIGHQVSVREIIEAPSVRGLCQLIERRPRARLSSFAPAQPRPAMEAVSPPDATVSADVPARRVVVTGTTGTLGPGILSALLDRPVDEVICLVRANDAEQARARTRAALARYGADPGLADDHRVRYWVADISQPDAGLPAAGLAAVTGADAVVNAAAWVNFLYPYESLMPVNVRGVATLARLAGQQQRKPLHHLSTRSALPVGGQPVVGGYNQSKAAAEAVVVRCRELGLQVSVYRPGFVLGRLIARPARPGLLEGFLRECLRAAAVPALPGCLNVVSADHVAVRIVDNVLSPAPRDCVELLGSAPLRWSAAWETLRGCGVEVKQVSPAAWLQMAAERREGEAWFEPFLPLCQSVGLAELISDEPNTDADEAGAQPVAEAWQQICAQLAALARS